MAFELVYTSVPNGLRQGSSGFCTVAYTNGLSPNIVLQLEGMSAYKTYFPHYDVNADKNPVAFSHYQMSNSEGVFHILSRVSFYGLDYSKRSNKLAHHIVIPNNEITFAQSGPAAVFKKSGLIRSEWNEAPRLFQKQCDISIQKDTFHKANTWEKYTGDAGYAGVLAEQYCTAPNKPIFIVYDPLQHTDILQLVHEALSLLPEKERWNVSFNTYFMTLPVGMRCHWRFCTINSAPIKEIQRLRDTVIIDLTKPLPQAPDSEFAEAARNGIWPTKKEEEIEQETKQVKQQVNQLQLRNKPRKATQLSLNSTGKSLNVSYDNNSRQKNYKLLIIALVSVISLLFILVVVLIILLLPKNLNINEQDNLIKQTNIKPKEKTNLPKEVSPKTKTLPPKSSTAEPGVKPSPNKNVPVEPGVKPSPNKNVPVEPVTKVESKDKVTNKTTVVKSESPSPSKDMNDFSAIIPEFKPKEVVKNDSKSNPKKSINEEFLIVKLHPKEGKISFEYKGADNKAIIRFKKKPIGACNETLARKEPFPINEEVKYRFSERDETISELNAFLKNNYANIIKNYNELKEEKDGGFVAKKDQIKELETKKAEASTDKDAHKKDVQIKKIKQEIAQIENALKIIEKCISIKDDESDLEDWKMITQSDISWKELRVLVDEKGKNELDEIFEGLDFDKGLKELYKLTKAQICLEREKPKIQNLEATLSRKNDTGNSKEVGKFKGIKVIIQ